MHMRGIAGQRVLERSLDRAAIGGIADFRVAYQRELAVNFAELEAEAVAFVARIRQFQRQ
jgi:hypothetical protein